MSDALKIALVVPDRHYDWDDERQFRVKELRSLCRKGGIDMVVFPEAYDGQVGRGIQEVVDEVVGHYLRRALEEASGNRTKAAELVGLASYQTFTNWARRYGVDGG